MILIHHIALITRWWDKQVLFPLASVVQPVLPPKVRNRPWFLVILAVPSLWEPCGFGGFVRPWCWNGNHPVTMAVQIWSHTGFGSDQSSRRMCCGVLCSCVVHSSWCIHVSCWWWRWPFYRGGLFIYFYFSRQLFFWVPGSMLSCFWFSAALLFCFSDFLLLCFCTSVPVYFYYSTFSFFRHVFLLLYFLLLCFFASCLYRLFVFHFLLLYSFLFVS